MYRNHKGTGVGRPLTGWSTGRQGRSWPSAAIQKVGVPAFPMPELSVEDRPPSTKQVAFAEMVSVQLGVAIPEACLASARCMRAFLDFYAQRLPHKD
jgi:hypothetical protein